MTELVPGANRALPDGPVSVSLTGPFDLSAVVVGADGQVSGDADFVFYNQPTAPGVRLRPGTVTIEPARLRGGAARVVLVASPEDGRTAFGRLPAPTLTVHDGGGRPLAGFRPPRLTTETVLQLAEIYRRNGAWKIRAIGQGYADGLAGLARDFGVEVDDDGTTAGSAAPVTGGPSAPPADTSTSRLLADVAALTNVERARAGLPALAIVPLLAAAAQAHSADMAARDFFAHESPEGSQVWDRVLAVGYRYAKVAENIAAGQRTPAEAVTGWMNSPGHRRNILDPELQQIGVGYVVGGRYGTYWTQVFGRPMR
jgi:uncharacterized protein YkwD/stress response protein SCP2